MGDPEDWALATLAPLRYLLQQDYTSIRAEPIYTE